MKATTKQVLITAAWFVVLLAMIGGTMLWQHQVRKPRHAVSSVTVTSTERIPTILLMDTSLDAEQQRQLIATMQYNNGSQTVINVKASANGTVTTNGALRNSDNRPYLTLQLPQNLTAAKQAALIKRVIQVTKQQLTFSRYNLVAYGSAGLMATNYLENTSHTLSPLHFVTIATPFNGTSTANNRQTKNAVPAANRSATLNRLITNRKSIDARVKVLLIAGNAKGKRNGDGVVPLQSALASQSIFHPTVKSYKQVVIHSWQAGHTSMLENWKLGNTIQEFFN